MCLVVRTSVPRDANKRWYKTRESFNATEFEVIGTEIRSIDVDLRTGASAKTCVYLWRISTAKVRAHARLCLYRKIINIFFNLCDFLLPFFLPINIVRLVHSLSPVCLESRAYA